MKTRRWNFFWVWMLVVQLLYLSVGCSQGGDGNQSAKRDGSLSPPLTARDDGQVDDPEDRQAPPVTKETDPHRELSAGDPSQVIVPSVPNNMTTPVEDIIGAPPELKPPVKRLPQPRLASPKKTRPKMASRRPPPRDSQFALPEARSMPQSTPRSFQSKSGGFVPAGDKEFPETAAPDPVGLESQNAGATGTTSNDSVAPQEFEATDPLDQEESSGGSSVQTKMTVFYATDRVAKTELQTGEWTSVFLNAIVAASIAFLFFGFSCFAKRKIIPIGLATLTLLTGLYFAYGSSIEWQKRIRLAKQGDAYYTAEMKMDSGTVELDYGTCQVNIPPDRRVGTVPSPSIFKLEFSEDPNKHIILERVIPSQKAAFVDELNRCLAQDVNRQAFVFIHGYNVGFEDAVKRTAQIAFDLKFTGAPICYSWASHGSLENYTRDFANANSTVTRLESFLKDLVSETQAKTVHLVAHSMGNHALLQALERMAGSHRGPEKMFGQLVMAAPDVSSIDFRHRYAEPIQKLTQQVTLYASSTDRALMASTSVWGHNRAGLSGDNLVVVTGVDTIDVSGVDTSLIGHSYYGDRPELIKDLRAIVELVGPASNRNWLERVIIASGQTYYKFR